MHQDMFPLKYCPELDGLRGIAILSVMIYHAYPPLLRGGYIGVDIFFVLSGFLITSLLMSEFDQYGSISLKGFYIRRVLRLAPALIILLMVFCFASFLFLSYQKAYSNYIDSLISLFYFSNWARAFSLHPPDFLGHTWSLSIEEQFYVIWPMLLLTLLRFFKARLLVVIFPLVIASVVWTFRIYLYENGAGPNRIYNGLDTRADTLMIGCTVGLAFASGYFQKKYIGESLSKVLLFMTPISVLCLLFFVFYSDWYAPHMYRFGFIFVEFFTAVLIIDIMVKRSIVIRKFLGMKLLVWVGSISYGLYLWHYPIYRTLYALKFSVLFVSIIGSILTFIIASLSYYFMEKPILKLKKYTRKSI